MSALPQAVHGGKRRDSNEGREQRHGEKTSKNAIETFQNAIPSCYNNLVNVHDTRLAEDCQMHRAVLQWK